MFQAREVTRFLETREGDGIDLKFPFSFFKNSNLGCFREHPKSVVLLTSLHFPGKLLKITHAGPHAGLRESVSGGKAWALAFVQSSQESLMHSQGWKSLS